MKLQVQAESLKEALSKILNVIDKRNPRAILTYCLFTAQNNEIVIEASDLEVSSKVIIPADIQESGKVCVNPKNLFDLVREMPNNPVTIEATDSSLLKIHCDQIDISLLVCGTEEFPQLSFEPMGNEFELTGEQTLGFINKTAHAMSHDETRIFLNGIFLQEMDHKLRAVATNGYTFALVESDEFESRSDALNDGVIIPKKGVQELKRVAEQNLSQKLSISVDESFMYINSNNNYFLSIRLIARDYPPYQTVIPTKTSYAMTVSKNNLLNAIKRIKVLANEKSNAIRLSLNEGSLTVSANHPTLGEASEKIQVDYKGKGIDIGFNARYVIDSLSVFGDDEITFEFNNELSPVIVKSHQMQQFLGIIMPLKL